MFFISFGKRNISAAKRIKAMRFFQKKRHANLYKEFDASKVGSALINNIKSSNKIAKGLLRNFRFKPESDAYIRLLKASYLKNESRQLRYWKSFLAFAKKRNAGHRLLNQINSEIKFSKRQLEEIKKNL